MALHATRGGLARALPLLVAGDRSRALVGEQGTTTGRVAPTAAGIRRPLRERGTRLRRRALMSRQGDRAGALRGAHPDGPRLLLAACRPGQAPEAGPPHGRGAHGAGLGRLPFGPAV